MPDAYREAFDDEAIALHAALVARRSGSTTRVEIWKDLPERVVAICIVADDRPGLLSQISAALVAHEIDVVTAHAYCRTRSDGAKEAVDFLWIRRVARPNGSIGPIRARDVAAIGEMVDALVRGNAKFDAAVHFARAIRTAEANTRVRFENAPRGEGDGTMLLTVEATDRPGLLLVVTKAIFRAGLQIIGLRATSEQGRAIDRFHLAEQDGKPLVQARLLSLQVEILTALEDGGADETSSAAAPP
ncbi:MAG: [Protein-PII] uridylyltransferase [Labilithrix sp.]|nr:[Protein-PII] uridylyltransferase [Labilithrix sp.]